MKKPVAYLETSFVSYLTGWVSEDEKVARDQSATRRWWQEEGDKWHCVVSEAVLDEARDGEADAVARRMDLLAGMESLESTEEAERLMKTLLMAYALPEKARADAMHVALATVHGADLLLTWKAGTIANSQRLVQVYLTLEKAGFKCPAIVTPEQLLAVKDPPGEIMQEVYRAREKLWQRGGGAMRGVCEYLRECERRAKARGVKWIDSEEEKEAIGAEVRARLAAEGQGALCVKEEAAAYGGGRWPWRRAKSRMRRQNGGRWRGRADSGAWKWTRCCPR